MFYCLITLLSFHVWLWQLTKTHLDNDKQNRLKWQKERRGVITVGCVVRPWSLCGGSFSSLGEKQVIKNCSLSDTRRCIYIYHFNSLLRKPLWSWCEVMALFSLVSHARRCQSRETLTLRENSRRSWTLDYFLLFAFLLFLISFLIDVIFHLFNFLILTFFLMVRYQRLLTAHWNSGSVRDHVSVRIHSRELSRPLWRPPAHASKFQPLKKKTCEFLLFSVQSFYMRLGKGRGNMSINNKTKNTTDSAFIFLIILLISQNQWLGWSG